MVDTTWIARRLHDGAELKKRLAAQAEVVARAGTALVRSLSQGGAVLLFGNGGSAADAQHLAAEFVGRFLRDRAPWPAIALTTDTSVLTAIGNDYGFDQVFARQVRALGKAGDVAIGISTSGRSPNVLAGVEAARERGLTTVGLTAGDGQPLAGMVDIPIVVPSRATPRVQECHLTIGHILCEFVEAQLLGETPAEPEPVPPPSRVTDWDTLLRLRRQWREEGKRVVWTNGCFDLLHAGHLRSLRAARALGDVLVVGVNGDESVRRLKGSTRPIVPAAERAELLAALECVDFAIIFDEPTPEASLDRLRPDVHCKGAEYAPPRGKPVVEAGLVEAYGGRVAFLPMLPAHSTTDLIERVSRRLAEERRP
jgi:phosphoheptose isomerase